MKCFVKFSGIEKKVKLDLPSGPPKFLLYNQKLYEYLGKLASGVVFFSYAEIDYHKISEKDLLT